ncbi:mariner transposase [Trichonephila clavipes]|nr:mariner transposase [Trichonephila clavipes]
MMDRISIFEALAKRNEINLFLKRMMTGDEKWVIYYNIVRKRSWSKCGEAAQTVGLERNHLLGVASAWPNTKFRSLLLTTGPFEAGDRPEMANKTGNVFHQDNARPHTYVVTCQNIWELG